MKCSDGFGFNLAARTTGNHDSVFEPGAAQRKPQTSLAQVQTRIDRQCGTRHAAQVQLIGKRALHRQKTVPEMSTELQYSILYSINIIIISRAFPSVNKGF